LTDHLERCAVEFTRETDGSVVSQPLYLGHRICVSQMMICSHEFAEDPVMSLSALGSAAVRKEERCRCGAKRIRFAGPEEVLRKIFPTLFPAEARGEDDDDSTGSGSSD